MFKDYIIANSSLFIYTIFSDLSYEPETRIINIILIFIILLVKSGEKPSNEQIFI